MKIEKIKKLLKSKHYDFLRVNEHLGSNIILLGLGGSHAYGTDTENSDLDIRGCALNKREEILIPIHNFDQVTEETTDTTIYSFNKLITLLSNCNPNTIELIGLKPEHYLYIHPIGQELLDNAEMFLSKKAIYSFGGYATSQLRRLDNKSARKLGQEERMQHVLNSIMNAFYTFPEKYFNFPEDAIKLYVDKGIQEDYETEVFMDIQLKHYPLNDYQGMWAEMKNIVRDYSKIGKRNKHAIEHNKLGKHMCHLVRLYLMCFDILEKGKIITYREDDHELLMALRNGEYLDANSQPNGELESWLFSNGAERLKAANADNYSSYVKNVMKKAHMYMGGTNYAPVLKEMVTYYKDIEPSEIPAFIIFITDGENSDTFATNAVIKELSEYNIFVQFIGIGDEDFDYLKSLDDMKDRKHDNTGFTAVKDMNKMSDEQLYTEILRQYKDWLNNK